MNLADDGVVRILDSTILAIIRSRRLQRPIASMSLLRLFEWLSLEGPAK